MRILVFEYITGGGLMDQPLPPSLAREGDLMVHALLRDLSELPGVSVTVSRDPRLSKPDAQVAVYYPQRTEKFWEVWTALVAEFDAVWPIAPETDHCLERLSEVVIAHGSSLLNSSPEAVRIASSKLEAARRMAGCGLSVVPTYELSDAWPAGDGPWVIKPDDGVGCMGARMANSAQELSALAHGGDDSCRWVLQAYVAGTPASLSLLCDDGEVCLLACNRQQVAVVDGEFRLLGCVVNDGGYSWGACEDLARGVVQAIPGLWGYVGVDLILTDNDAIILEVNPRLTTSYVGLRESTGVNPAELLLDGRLKAPIVTQRSIRPVVVDLGLNGRLA